MFNNFRISHTKTHQLEEACRYGDFERVKKFTDTKKITYADMNANSHHALKLACMSNNVEIIDYLMTHPRNTMSLNGAFQYVCACDDQTVQRYFHLLDPQDKFYPLTLSLGIDTLVKRNNLSMLKYIIEKTPDFSDDFIKDIVKLSMQLEKIDIFCYFVQHHTAAIQDWKLLIYGWISQKDVKKYKALDTLFTLPTIKNHPEKDIFYATHIHQELDHEQWERVENLLFHSTSDDAPKLPFYKIENEHIYNSTEDKTTFYRLYGKNDDYNMLHRTLNECSIERVRIYFMALKNQDLLGYYDMRSLLKTYCEKHKAMNIYEEIENMSVKPVKTQEETLLLV